jgi:hypothetical protein
VRRWLFPVDSGYPIFCTAESVATKEDRKRRVEFYLINRRDEALTRSALIERLRDRVPQTAASPDIVLKLLRGSVDNAYSDEVFNQDKGVLTVPQDSKVVNISIDQMAPRAMLRVVIEVSGLIEHPGTPYTRATRSGVHSLFDVEQFQESCYSK